MQARLEGVASLDGVLGADTVVLESSAASAMFLDRNVGTAKPVSVSGLALSGTHAANYALAGPTGLSASITPRPLSISFSVADKVYDGTVSAAATVQDDRINGDRLSLAFAAAFADRNAQEGKRVNITGITLDGPDAFNYAVPGTASTVGRILQRPLATWTSAASGNWSNAANWDALPDGNNVASVIIPASPGLQVTYDLSALNLGSLSNAANLVVAGGGLKLGALNNVGSLVVTSALDLTGVQAVGAGTLNNQGLLTLSGSGVASTLTNSGTLLASASNRLASLVNTGVFTVASGSTQITGTFTQTSGTTTLGTTATTTGTLGAGAGATVSGGRFQGTGTVAGNLNVTNAVLAPGFSPGALNVQGNLVLGAGAVLEVELAGTTPDAYDRISTSGSLQLDGGQLLLSSLNNFKPLLGQTFQILTTQAAVSGSFGIVTTTGSNLEALQLGNLVLTSTAGNTTIPTQSSTLATPAIETEIAKTLTTSTTTTATSSVAVSPAVSALTTAAAASALTTSA